MPLADSPVLWNEIPKNPSGEHLNPHCWDFDFIMDIDAAIEGFKQSHPLKQGKESEHHYLLKLASMLYLSQMFGDMPFLREVTEDKYRSDVYCQTHNNLTIRVEAGNLTYRDKIEYLLNTLKTDIVVWVPYPDADQGHYFADVDFINRCLRQRNVPERDFPYAFGTGNIIAAKSGERKYYVTYAAFFESDHNDTIIPFFEFYRKAIYERTEATIEKESTGDRRQASPSKTHPLSNAVVT
jgi:hypothetical protein